MSAPAAAAAAGPPAAPINQIRDMADRALDEHMAGLVERHIIPAVRMYAAAANLPPGFADGVGFVKTGPNRGKLVNTWGDSRKPLAKWFNYGTVRHWVAPVHAKVLAWTHRGPGRHAQAIYFRGEAKEGDQLFSKGHYVSGVPRTEVMERGLAEGMKAVREEAGRIVGEALQGNVGGR